MGMKTMFWNWFRWQCLNRDGIIDEDEVTIQIMKLVKTKRITYEECQLTGKRMLVHWGG